MKYLYLSFLLLLTARVYAQSPAAVRPHLLHFGDTVQLGCIEPETHIQALKGDTLLQYPLSMTRAVLHFRFTWGGPDSLLVSKPFTGDPHFICEYPRTPLRHGQTYVFTLCISLQRGPMHKYMGFLHPDGTRTGMNFRFLILFEEEMNLPVPVGEAPVPGRD